MKIRFHKSFLKSYDRLPKNIQSKAEERIKIFSNNQQDPRLKDHALQGKMAGKRAFSITGDYRIIYQRTNKGWTLLFIDIGTHSQVYK